MSLVSTPALVSPLLLSFVQGSAWQWRGRFHNVDGSTIDLAGASLLMTVRESATSTVILMSATSTSGAITADGTDSTILNMDIPGSDSQGLPFRLSEVRFSFDIVATFPGGMVQQLVSGLLRVQMAVSRPWEGP